MNSNAYFVISVAAEIMCVHVFVYLIYLRAKRKSIEAKYKPNSREYKNYLSLVRPSMLLAAIVAVILVTTNLVASAQAILHTNSGHSVMVFGIVACTLIYLVSLLITYKYFELGK